MSARREAMSVDLLQSPDVTWQPENDNARPTISQLSTEWNPDRFAREQIQGLVRKVFFSSAARPVRQVVFSAIDTETDVRGVCRQVGEALADEAAGSVAVMGGFPQLVQAADTNEMHEERIRQGSAPPLRRIATRVGANLWLVPGSGSDGERTTTASLHSYLGELRREFDYSIVQAAPAGESNDTTAMAQFADGIILILSARNTRRITARQVQRRLAAAETRLLGTILCDREFPIPQRIYRRL
jgi:hypothetical protein